MPGTSISSGLSQAWIETYRNALGANPHVKYFDSRQGGYVRCDLDSDRFRADFLLANSLGDRLSPVRTIASFEVYPESDPAKSEGAKQVYREALLGPPRWIDIGADGVLRADGPYERGWYNTDNTTGELYPLWFRYGQALVRPPRWIGIGADGVLRADGAYERGWYNTDNMMGQLYPEWFRP